MEDVGFNRFVCDSVGDVDVPMIGFVVVVGIIDGVVDVSVYAETVGSVWNIREDVDDVVVGELRIIAVEG